MRSSSQPILALALFAALAGTTGSSQAQPMGQNQQIIDEGQVVSSTPIIEQGRTVGYNVSYDFAGRRYSTQMAQRPGATIQVQVSPMGVTTATGPLENGAYAPAQQQPQQQPQQRQGDSSAWQNVVPEPGVVVGSGPTPYPQTSYPRTVYPQTTYVQPAYSYAAPMVVAPYGYGYAPTHYASPFYAPIGLSLNFGYSRGWGGRGGRWR